MSTAKEQGALARYLVVYICLLVISAIELVIAYHPPSGAQLLASMLLLAFIGALLGLLVFMGLGAERRTLVIAFAVFTLFVLATINYGWTDSFRLLHGVPFAK
jgi:heme/copper-type cytochrome/quinol oxidase subunit 4